MRKIASFAILTLCFAALAPAQQQLARFSVGDTVDFNTSGRWIPCSVSSPLTAGYYGLHCGTVDLHTKADSDQLRAHIVAINVFGQQPAAPKSEVAISPLPASLGARYGTREPRTNCDRHKSPAAGDDAKDLIICDAEREFGGKLFLVSNVSVDLVKPRALTAGELSGVPGIDRSQPIYEIHASFDKYQCAPIPRDRDYPNIRNCSEFKVSSAPGGCYKTTAGDWHCITYSGDSASAALTTEAKPPTLTD